MGSCCGATCARREPISKPCISGLAMNSLISAPSSESLVALRTAALDRTYVSLGDRRTSSVHEFYRYPARFSPGFVRSAIDAFTLPGDLVLDPFVGGGTTVAEAQLAGRRSVGADLNSLAAFVTTSKAEVRSDAAAAEVERWAERIGDFINMQKFAPTPTAWLNAGYLRNFDGPEHWRMRKAIAQALMSLNRISDPAAVRLARLAILRTSQSLLDMRSEDASIPDFRIRLATNAAGMARVSNSYAAEVRRAMGGQVSDAGFQVVKCGLPGLGTRLRADQVDAPRLIVTSPPYPGVYVLYHRWKLQGRRETPAPYWIASELDGQGLSHYTMGARADKTLDTYFQRLADAYRDLASLASEITWIAQLVGFSDVPSQLPRYLDTMAAVGLEEVRFPELETAPDGRCWREVPSRRWWVAASAMGKVASHTSREVLLVHRPRR